jgi:hypothetical protein
MSTANDWAKAYARQAEADLRTWARLYGDTDTPACHQLMFLQMACEKLTKAHLCTTGTDPKDLQSSHAFTTKNLPTIIREQIISSGIRHQRVAGIMRHAKHVASEIELLAPAVKRGGQRPDNCEYPWEDSKGELHLPLDWTFSTSQLLLVPAGRTILKLIEEAVWRFLSLDVT